MGARGELWFLFRGYHVEPWLAEGQKKNGGGPPGKQVKLRGMYVPVVRRMGGYMDYATTSCPTCDRYFYGSFLFFRAVHTALKTVWKRRSTLGERQSGLVDWCPYAPRLWGGGG